MSYGFYYTTIRIDSNCATVLANAEKVIMGKQFAMGMEFQDSPRRIRGKTGTEIDIGYCGYCTMGDRQIRLLEGVTKLKGNASCGIVVHERTDSDFDETVLHAFRKGKFSRLLREDVSINIDEAVNAAKALHGDQKATERLFEAFVGLDECDSYSPVLEIFGVARMLHKVNFAPSSSHYDGWKGKYMFLSQLDWSEVGESLRRDNADLLAWIEATTLQAGHGNSTGRQPKSI